MKSSIVLFCSVLGSIGALAAPYGWDDSSIAAVPTTDCDSATYAYDHSSAPAEPTIPYEASTPAWYPPPNSSVEPTPVPYYGTPSSEPAETPVPTGYGSVPYYPADEPTTTLTSTIDSTITLEVTVSSYDGPGTPASSIPGYYSVVTTTSCPPESSSEAGYVPYTPTLTPVVYENTTPASAYEPETPAPQPYPTGPAYYPPGNGSIPTPAVPSVNNTYQTAPPYYLPPYAGSATNMKVNKGGLVGTGIGLTLMVVFMGIL
ncbi:hypothetical protein ABW21_db0200244 [Orbilia brochopaga]|nr:hypothetical protein ABW21_db0200244 [Drechslerella brochopaga]